MNLLTIMTVVTVMVMNVMVVVRSGGLIMKLCRYSVQCSATVATFD